MSLMRAFISSREMLGCMAVSFKVIRNGSPGQTGVTVLVRRESCHGVVVALLGAGEGEAGVDLPGLAWPL